ncbi:mitochondrial carrier domain-containing protein [Chaetomium sp. MPI-CAGE-AT-0009]|nr:mitochondrial carrier domain-containing protein [Chaetomium sp. MPI-CAGE-AT-0009]
MSADFWAGSISGAAGIILGNPLDVLKVRLQAGITTRSPSPPITFPSAAPSTSLSYSYARPFLLGTAAPVLGYGALNALLFVSYNHTEAFLNHLSGSDTGGCTTQTGQARGTNLYTAWVAGAVGGLATWVVSTPTELVKCRAQLQIPAPSPTRTGTLPNPASIHSHSRGQPPSPPSSPSSWLITKHLVQTHGLRGLYAGGAVTSLRDSIGYGFYFWGYEVCSRGMRHLIPSPATGTATTTTTLGDDGSSGSSSSAAGMEAARVLLCGGLAGIITWASIFPLDVVKTRVQTQFLGGGGGGGGGGGDGNGGRRLGAWEVARQTYREGGLRPFFRGLGVCSVRAFMVNAVQWAVYEWVMAELGQGRRAAREDEEVGVLAV